MNYSANLMQLLLALSLMLFADVAIGRPNFVFILTDDQDAHMESVTHMPELQEHLVEKGVTFSQHYCTSLSSSWIVLLNDQLAH